MGGKMMKGIIFIDEGVGDKYLRFLRVKDWKWDIRRMGFIRNEGVPEFTMKEKYVMT